MGDASSSDAVEPARVDLVHRVPAEALRRASSRSPRAPATCRAARSGRCCRRQVALLDRHAERRAVGDADAVQLRAGVGVGVEVDDGVPVARRTSRRAPAAWAARASGRRRGRAASRPRRAPRAAPRPGARGCATGRPGDLAVAVVHDVEDGERVEPRAQVRPAGVAAVVGRADRPRAEARARPVRRAVVERRADDRDVDALERGRSGDEPAARERRTDADVDRCVAAHAELVEAVHAPDPSRSGRVQRRRSSPCRSRSGGRGPRRRRTGRSPGRRGR